MEKKNYNKPKIKTIDIDKVTMLCVKSKFENGHDNGNHKGWDNPRNPHYNGNSFEDKTFSENNF
ncbi:MAG: hypothetical protein HUJ68_01030 [Clostridia bacterium]|nr:hypothetical protein [Clostridia bacterium]